MKGWRLYGAVICLSLLFIACGCGSDDTTIPDDKTPLPVSSTVPPDGATDVPVDIIITATFREDIDPASITDTTFTVSYNPLVPGTVAYDSGTKTATFTPDDDLEFDTEYTVSITAEVLGMAGMGSPMTIVYAWRFYSIPGYTGNASLPRTGQITSYATGDDGDYEVGVAWPIPRFTDNEDGTITDNLTGLMWLKDAHCLGFNIVQGEAYNNIDTLNYYPDTFDCQDYTAGYTDWRFANVNELESLVNAGSGHIASWLHSQGFVNVQALNYASSTTYAYNTMWALYINMWAGFTDIGAKSNYSSIWPVRGKTTLPSRVWKTGQTTSYRPNDDGDLQAGANWPVPRFYLNINNAMVTDLLTLLTWARGAETPTYGECTGGRMTWPEALDYIACLNASNFLGCSDWRLPNRKELYSLIDHSNYNPALPSDHCFMEVQNSKYWTSTTYAYGTSSAWMVDIQYGYVNPWNKTLTAYVWPVRGGL